MKNRVTIKFAASTLILGLTMVGCASSGDRAIASASRGSQPEQQANQFYARAQQAAQQGDMAEALGHAERAVELSPRDSGYRMLLADLYLKNGRFRSAEQSFGDVLTLDPDNKRAAFNRALAQIGLGERGAALAQLEILSATAAPGDLGLAYALAGQPKRAVEMLERAARAPGADGRVRQNLALAYALAGDWQKARVTAAQDVSPAELAPRLRQWAALANPTAAANQLASLLGVTQVDDAGQPVRLALAPVQAEPAVAVAYDNSEDSDSEVASVVVEPSAVAAETAPIVTAAADVAPPVVYEAPAAPRSVAAAQALPTRPAGFVRQASADISTPAYSAPVAGRKADRRPAAVNSGGSGRYAVQLGSFSTAANVERAWAQAYRRYGFGGHQPLSTTIGIKGKGTFHRLSVAGFESHAEASRICRSVQAKGGTCFVRAVAGDAPVRWAWRYTGRRA